MGQNLSYITYVAHGDLTGKQGKSVHCTVRHKQILPVPARVPRGGILSITI